MRTKREWLNHRNQYSLIRKTDKGDNFLHYSMIDLDGYKILTENQLMELELLEINQGFRFKSIIPRKEISNMK